MEKVIYVVLANYPYEGSDLISLFDTLELAEQEILKLKQLQFYRGANLEISEFVLNKSNK